MKKIIIILLIFTTNLVIGQRPAMSNIDMNNLSIKNIRLNPKTQTEINGLVLNVTHEGYIVYNSTLDKFQYWNGSTWIVLITDNSAWDNPDGTPATQNSTTINYTAGNVGIGTNVPTAKLEVAGQVKITGGTPGLNKVLTSDAVGLATWQPVTVPTFDATVNFSTTTPTTAGVVFTPNLPATTTVLYVSAVDGSQWTYNGTTYVTQPASADWKTSGNAGSVQATNFVGTTDNVGLTFRTNNTIRQTITNTGDVGIGNNAPLSKLDVFGGALIGSQKGLNDAASSVGANILNVSTPTKITTTAITTPETALRLFRAGNFNVKWNPSADLQVGTYATGINALSNLKFRLGNGNTSIPEIDVMTLQGNGNVGIGTTTPTQKLQVSGNLLVSTENSGFGIDTGNTRLGFIKKSGFSPMMVSANGTPIIFAQSNQTSILSNISSAILTERMRIDAVGNLGIGTTAPTQKLHVIGNILASGTITPSDKRLKSNIKDVTYGVKELLKLKPVSYTKKFSLDKAETGEVKEIGFIAQDLQKSLPELVTENGTDKLLAVNYTSIIPILVKAIQEQQNEIEKLKKIINKK